MTANAQLVECFDKAFANGMSDIKFFVRKSDALSAESLSAEIVAFQAVIDAGRTQKIAAVD